MKKFVVTLWSICLLLTVSNQLFAIGGNMGNGNGTEAAPYLIEDLEDFDEFASNSAYWAEGIYTKMMSDIDMTGRTNDKAVIAPDNDYDTFGVQETPFQGIFDGNNNIISNMTIDSQGTSNSYLGLFGGIETGGIIQNLTISNYSINTSNNTSDYISELGGICGNINEGSIINCHTTGFITGNLLADVGGLCGQSKSSNIRDSSSNVTIIAGIHTQSIGGLIGKNKLGTISNCLSTGSINVDIAGEFLGGFIGDNYGHVSNCNSSTQISCNQSSSSVGAFCGTNYNTNITMCYSTGDIITGNYCDKIGGFCGINYDTIEKCFATGSIAVGDGSSNIGGFCGYNNKGNQDHSIVNCYAKGSITGSENLRFAGGFIGANEESFFSDTENLTINCYSTGSVTAISGSFLNGFGQTENLSVNCFWDTDTSGIEDSYSNHNGLPYGLPTEQMQTASTFIDSGWDFAKVWAIGNNQTYPYLRTSSGTDINGDGIVNLFDLQLLAGDWLKGATQ